MVAPSPRARRPPPRPQPRPLPPSAGRRPPPYPYGPPPRRHGGRRLLVLILVVATLAAVGYLYLNRGGSTATATGYLGANQQSIKAANTVIAASTTVQRFAELHAFDVVASVEGQNLAQQLTKLEHAAAGASGRQKQIAGDSVNTVQQGIDAVAQYRKAVAFTYRLIDAQTAHQELDNVVAALKQQAQQWQHS